MSLLIAIPAFLVAIGVLVTFHELGHYWAARLCGVKILRFSVGFGEPLWLRPDKNNTEWVVATFPLGGYVKMADERDGSCLPGEEAGAFNRKPVWQRSLIVAAGPAANFVLAAFFYWVLFVSGVPGIKPYVSAPLPGSTAAAAGFAEDDLILRVGDEPVRTWTDARLALIVSAAARETVEIEVETAKGEKQLRRLDLSAVSKDDLDKDFLTRVSLNPWDPPAQTVIQGVLPGGPAERAGLRSQDRVVSIDGVEVARRSSLVKLVAARPGKTFPVVVERDKTRLEVTVTAEALAAGGQTVGPAIGRIGVEVLAQPLTDRESIVVRYSPWEAFPRAWGSVVNMSWFSLKMMGRMLTGDISWKNLSGPISIAQYAGKSAEVGWLAYLNYLALISISLGVLNLLPVPVLDGGQLMYHIAEVFKGSPVSERAMEIGQQVGLTLLLGLTAFAFYNDIHRLVSG